MEENQNYNINNNHNNYNYNNNNYYNNNSNKLKIICLLIVLLIYLFVHSIIFIACLYDSDIIVLNIIAGLDCLNYIIESILILLFLIKNNYDFYKFGYILSFLPIFYQVCLLFAIFIIYTNKFRSNHNAYFAFIVLMAISSVLESIIPCIFYCFKRNELDYNDINI